MPILIGRNASPRAAFPETAQNVPLPVTAFRQNVRHAVRGMPEE
jgi:hypothetical protein